MVDLALVGKGILYFFFGVLGSIVSYYIIPVFISYLPTNTLKAIFWVGLIIVWILAIIVNPVHCIIKGMKSPG